MYKLNIQGLVYLFYHTYKVYLSTDHIQGLNQLLTVLYTDFDQTLVNSLHGIVK